MDYYLCCCCDDNRRKIRQGSPGTVKDEKETLLLLFDDKKIKMTRKFEMIYLFNLLIWENPVIINCSATQGIIKEKCLFQLVITSE